jgi:hypothetical protein
MLCVALGTAVVRHTDQDTMIACHVHALLETFHAG